MDDVSKLLSMNGKDKPSEPKVYLVVDGEKVTDPKDILSYVEENMSDAEEDASESETEDPEEKPMKKDSEYVPGSMNWN